ncbi:MAG: ATPase, T2SS/T4P/T4SS family, partial [Planctomycetota bacterium]|nr:ATPase, T2SS/T4P/T4SS family [Planctomycetota bacterium]
MILSSTTRQNDPLSPREFQRIKTSIHEELVESLDLAAVGLIDDQQMRSEVKDLGHAIYKQRRLKLSQDDKGKLIDELADEVFGLGPIEPLLSDPSVSDILVNGAEEVFVERQGRLEKTDIVFADNAHVMRIIQRVVSKVGRRVDEASPMVDARLPDGSRVNAVIPPLALDGPKLSIRRFATDRLQLPQLQENGSLNAPIVEFLSACVAARIGVLISGGTGAGKTTLLNALSSAIPADERIVTIEDSAELSMNHPHVVKLETR